MRSLLPTLAVSVILFAAFAGGLPTSLAQEADPPTYVVSGRVTSDQGVPLEGVIVNGYTMPADQPESRSMVPEKYAPAQAFTDAEGRYALKLAAGKGYVSVYYEKWSQSDGRDLLLEADTVIDFTLKTPPPRDAILTGRIVDAAGNPVAGADVSLSGGCCYAYAEPAVAEPATSDASSGSGSAPSAMLVRPDPYYDDYQTTTTGADGVYRFETYAGMRQVTATARGFAQTTDQVETKAGETTTLDLVLLQVPPRDAVISGRVIDSSTGQPIEGAQVSLRNLEWNRYSWAETKADGTYRFETLRGWSEISVQVYPRYDEPVPLAEGDSISIAKPVAARGPQYYGETTIVKVQSGENAVETSLDPKPAPTIPLIGYVVDPDAKTGVPGARVSFYNHESGDWGEAVTDATGSFRILVRAGHYSANAWKDGYLGGSQTFLVEDGAVQRVDVILPKGEARYAPCYDESDCGGIMYSRGVAMDAAVAEEKAAPAMAPTAAAGAESSSRVAAADDDGATRAASFEGSGGGLPPYDPSETGVPAGTKDADAPVPGFGVVALLAALGVALLARRVMKN